MAFFHRQTPVLFYSRDRLILALVTETKTPVRKIVLESKLDFENIDQILNKLKAEVGDEGWRVLVADELCYLFDLTFPKETTIVRKNVSEHVMASVPEYLSEEDWDYRILESKTDGDQVVQVFSPVQSQWLQLKRALIKAEIEVVAAEPEAMALARNADPFIALALKKDLTGKDANILNIRVSQKPLLLRLIKKLTLPKYRWVSLSLLVTLMVSIFASGFVAMQLNQAKSNQNQVEMEVAQLEVAPTIPIISPTQAPIILAKEVLADYSVEIQNASGNSKLTADLKAKLLAVGFEDVSTKNLASTSATVSATAKIKPGLPDGILDTLRRVLTQTDIQTASLSGINKVDIVILLTKQE